LNADRHRYRLIYLGVSFETLLKIGRPSAHKDLVMSEEMEENLELRRRLNLTPSMLSAIEPDGRHTWLNDVALQYFGHSAADIALGDLRRRVVLPDDFERVQEERQMALAGGSPFEYENRLRRHDGQYRWFLIRYQPLKNEAGRVVRWYASATDIEDRKRSEVHLRRSEAYLAEAQGLTHTGSWATNPVTGEIKYLSEELLRILGVDPQRRRLPDVEEFFSQIVHPDDRDRFREVWERACREKAEFSWGYRAVQPDGTERHIHTIGHPVLDETGELVEFVGTAVDVTERKRAEEERARLRLELFEVSVEARVAERTRIARDLHDTLLQSFQGLLLRFQTVSDLLSTRPAEAKNVLAGAIEQAASAITEGREAVQALRTAAEEEPKDLAAAIQTLGDDLAAEPAPNHAASLRVDVEGAVRSLHPIIRDEVYRIAGEALRNAVQHSQGTQIVVELRYDWRQFCLRIRDDGKGIHAKVLADWGREGHYGLRGMRERADLIGGELNVRSQPDAGTEVEFTIAASRAYFNARPATKHNRSTK
jgi:PAS domain S-box-containing protein